MATRLERLWVLLDSGSTPVTRKAAAEQIGEVQKLHPHELNNLLRKVCTYLTSKSWETRVAAGQAVEAIAKNVKRWQPNSSSRQASPSSVIGLAEGGGEGRSKESSPDSVDKDSDLLTFDTFDLDKVLAYGTPLLSSTIDEFQALENDPEYQKMTQQERIAFHRQQLKQRLGLTAQGKVFSSGVDQLFDDSDLLIQSSNSPSAGSDSAALKKNGKKASEVHELSALQLSGLSARERNRAKRKAKQMARRASKDSEKRNESEPPPSKKVKTSSVVVEQAGQSDRLLIDQVTDMDSIFDESEEWPFTWFCEEMFKSLFNPCWEVRHGAATALREVVKHHGDTAGISVYTPETNYHGENQKWLVDAAIRMICVFALDRFADFVSDQVVTPVRATCAQALGMVVRQMEREYVESVVTTLLSLAAQDQWEVRHASLMGMQHLLAARTDLSDVFLPLLSSAILRGLQDVDDDVRAVAASSLLPVAHQLHLVIPQQVDELSQILWDSLLELDDLSASTSCIMELLCTLLSHNPTLFSTHCHTHQPQPSMLTTLVPRLWPFLSHTITTVRHSCLKALLTLLHATDGKDADDSVMETDDNNLQTSSDSNVGVATTGQPDWLSGPFLQSALCQVFQRFALEGDEENRHLLHKVWSGILQRSSGEEIASAIAPLFQSMAWLWLLVVPSHAPIETNLLVPPSPEATVSTTLYLGGCLGIESPTVREQATLAARIAGAKALGELVMKLSRSLAASSDQHTTAVQQSTNDSLTGNILLQFVSGLQQFLARNFAMHKMIVGLVLTLWKGCGYKDQLVSQLTSALTEESGYEELMPFLLAMQKDCHSLIVALEKKGVKVGADLTPSAYTTEFAANLATTAFKRLQNVPLQNHERAEIDSLCRCLLTSLGQLKEEQQQLCMRVRSCIAGALISLSSLPGKFNPVIRPLMDCIKTDSNAYMQQLASEWTSWLLDMCKERTPCPNSKIIKNLCGFLCCDTQHTPNVVPKTDDVGRSGTETWEWNNGIITLIKQQHKLQPLSGRAKGRPSAAVKEAMAAYAACEEQRKPLVYQRQGAESAVTALARHFGSTLFSSLPQLWINITQPFSLLTLLSSTPSQGPNEEQISSAQSVVNGLQVLEVLAPSLHPDLFDQLFSLLPHLLTCLCSLYTAVRHMAARCLATLAQVQLHRTMQFIISDVLPFLGDADSVVHREGAIEVLACLLEMVGLDALCYIVLLLMPVLGRMSDQQQEVRHMASRCFAVLVSYMPLESGVSSPPEMPADLVERRKSDRLFLEQLLDTSKLENYSVPISINTHLRKYQQDGINWLAFMNKYNLHGILCDDMGLGKTLQSLCIIAGDHCHRCKQYESTGHSDSLPLPSLVVCPPTLTGHWYYEVKKFCKPEDLSPLQYSGPPNTRARLQSLVSKHNLIIASYDIVRNDIDFFRSINWNYCVLDEGHIIKNTKTKITKAVKLLRANHRLILSGTPIQNNVLELWSLFDFLMPGFLGTERQFYERYGKPIIQSRDAKSSSREQEAGALAMEALHRQVLPFLLRRMKEDVLQDLPPKIIQDYHCDLSPLQIKLYEDFAKSQAKQEVDEVIEGEGAENKPTPPPTHIFQALQYLRKLCNHPTLVVNPDHPMFDQVQRYLEAHSTSLSDIKHAAKLTALKQLLYDCGIGLEAAGEEEVTSVVGQHRALIFCQYKSMLDIIERDLFKVHMPTLTYLRLDGSVPATNRFSLVSKFNNDPSIDVLLLTTHVGGLGLNLTGADTVIFFEHDWNPMKDLQAMDRAHRIGQKKVVNVYRLITKGTLEEKIMSLQKFKLNLANTVISQENSSLLSMNTSELLDLFQFTDTGELSRGGGEKAGGSSAPVAGKESMRSVLENLPELWSEEQYRSEYDLSSFMKSLTSVEK